MKTPIIVLMGIATLAACVPSPAYAQTAAPTCADRKALVRSLAENFGEAQHSFGIQQDGNVLEVYAAASGSWTVVLSMPGGRSCIMAAGEAWSESTMFAPGRPL